MVEERGVVQNIFLFHFKNRSRSPQAEHVSPEFEEDKKENLNPALNGQDDRTRKTQTRIKKSKNVVLHELLFALPIVKFGWN